MAEQSNRDFSHKGIAGELANFSVAGVQRGKEADFDFHKLRTVRAQVGA